MSIDSEDIVPLSQARAKLTELCEEVTQKGEEKIITKNGHGYAALIDAKRLDYYHRIEREQIHVTLLDEAIAGLEDLKEDRTLTLNQLLKRHGR